MRDRRHADRLFETKSLFFIICLIFLRLALWSGLDAVFVAK